MIIYIDDYFLGSERVSLFADTNLEGGYFSHFSNETDTIHPKDTKHGKIVVGFSHCNRWRDVFEILLHEVTEYAFTRIRCRLMSCDRDNVDNAAYTFILTHSQFSQAVQWSSWFLCPAMPDLCSAWRKSQKKPKRKKK